MQRWRFSPADPDNVDADELALPMRFRPGRGDDVSPLSDWLAGVCGYRRSWPDHAHARACRGRVQTTRTGGCRDSLWGCAPAADTDGGESNEPPRVRYDRLFGQARRGLASLRFTSPAAAATTITDTVQKLSDAAALLPDDYEAPSLLGQLELSAVAWSPPGSSCDGPRSSICIPSPTQRAADEGLCPPSLPLEQRDPALAWRWPCRRRRAIWRRRCAAISACMKRRHTARACSIAWPMC